MVSSMGTDLCRSAESGSYALTIARARNVLHSVFSEKRGSQPIKAESVAFRRSVNLNVVISSDHSFGLYFINSVLWCMTSPMVLIVPVVEF